MHKVLTQESNKIIHLLLKLEIFKVVDRVIHKLNTISKINL
jgi:hypothetical protein